MGMDGLEISIKASRRYHGNHQEVDMTSDKTPYEAFSLTHISTEVVLTKSKETNKKKLHTRNKKVQKSVFNCCFH